MYWGKLSRLDSIADRRETRILAVPLCAAIFALSTYSAIGRFEYV